MRNVFAKVIVVGVLAGLISIPARGADKEKGGSDSLEDRVHAVNQTAEKAGRMNVALQRISTETGIPQDQVQASHRRYPDTGAAGLLIAGVLADETKKPFEQFLKQHSSGRKWGAIARDNKVSIESLIARLDRFEKALPAEKEKKK